MHMQVVKADKRERKLTYSGPLAVERMARWVATHSLALVQAYACMHKYIYTYAHMHALAGPRAGICPYVHIYIYAPSGICIYMHMHGVSEVGA